MKKINLTLLLIFIFANFVFAQNSKIIKGKVIDKSDNTTLIGATLLVLLPNSNEIDYTAGGATTDFDGNFELRIPAKATRFMVQYMGYKPQIFEVNNVNSPLQILLEIDSQAIEEVVVTGYGGIERRKVTASIEKITLDEVPKNAMSVDQMLQGQLSGVSVQAVSGAPGSAAKIRIRGTSSLNGTQDPLWVLDGIPLEGTDLPDMSDNNIDQLYSSAIAGINPSDIESITVLKDAAATAIYGARAANGVIVITTKKGKIGKIRVNYSGKTSVISRPNLDRLKLLNAEQKVNLELDLLKSDYDYMSKKGGVARILDALNEKDIFIKNGWEAISPEAKEKINELKNNNTNWNNELFRPTMSQDHFISLSGGNENAAYYFSTGFYDEKGATIGVGTRRYNITAKTEFRFSEKFKVGVSLFGNQRQNNSYLTTTTGFSNPVFYSRRANPYQPIYLSDGNYAPDLDMQGYGKNGDALPFNIIQERDATKNIMQKKAINAILDLEYRILETLVFESQFGVQYDDSQLETLAEEQSYATRYERKKGELTTGSFVPKGGVLKSTAGNSFQYTFKNMLRYKTKFSDWHDFEIMLGTELRKNKDKNIFSAAYGYDPNTLTSKPIIYPDPSYAVAFPLFRKNLYENAFVSFFGTSSYTFNDRYTFGASIRYDGSNIFGVDPQYRYLPLYSISLLWRASEEEFLKNQKWLSNLSFRISYGLQGNIDKSTSPKLVGEWKPELTLLPGAFEPNIAVSSPPNEKLRWEKTSSFNAGVDVAVIKNRFKLSADFYYRRSNDLIGMKRLPLETGFDYTTINWSSMSNRGIELNLSALFLKTTNWSWNSQLNFAYNQNTVHKLTVRSDQRTPVIEGYPVGAIFTLPYAGLDEYGYPLIYDENNNPVLITNLFDLKTGVGGSIERGLSPIDQRSRYRYAGTDEPPYSGGWTNRITFRNWEFSTSLTFNFGHKVLIKPFYSLSAYDRGMNTSNHILDRWTVQNPNGKYPRLITEKTIDGKRLTEYGAYNYFKYDQNLDLWLRDAGYVRLQALRLAYKVPNEITKKWKIDNIKLALEANNLFVYGFDYEGFLDPETMKNPFAQPIPKTITLSINVGF